MRIGIDLHGVLDKDPEHLKEVLLLARREGSEIYVISGPPTDQIIRELEALGFGGSYYDEIISVVDWLHKNGYSEYMHQDEKGEWHTTDEYWWSSKGKICKEYDICALFDDSLKYQPTCEELGIVYIHYPSIRTLGV
jgi:hypothetical protein